MWAGAVHARQSVEDAALHLLCCVSIVCNHYAASRTMTATPGAIDSSTVVFAEVHNSTVP